MEQRVFGNPGLKIPALSLGTFGGTTDVKNR